MLTSYFDAVLVHSDPAFARIEESLAAGVRLPVDVHHTGFVHESTAVDGSRPRLRRPSMIVSAGGGLVGEPLLHAALEAQSLILARLRRPMTIVAGPFLPEDAWRRLRQAVSRTPETAIRRSVPNLALEMRSALGSISQCGYNTAMDLIVSGVPALVVPFGEGAEDEQLKRARRLEALGVLRVLLPSELSPTRLADEMTTLTSFAPAAAKLNLHGARTTADILAAMVHGRTAAAASMRRTA
jgi:predicted glycosyltransferase